MKVLFVAAEAVPFIKTGGLADVIGSLPKELCKSGIDARVVLPKYEDIPQEYKDKMVTVASSQFVIYGSTRHFNIQKLTVDGVVTYFIENDYFFKRHGLYGHFDDAERFAFFCRAAMMLIELVDFVPDVIHSHDWHAALTGVYLRAYYQEHGKYTNIKNVFTIHNLKYQGIFDKSVFFDLLDLEWNYFSSDKLEYHDKVNFMKGGIIFADMVSTVSGTYAKEIQSPYFGEALDGLLSACSHKLTGIVNGIDYDFYNPAKDTMIPFNYTVDNVRQQKVKNKAALREKLGLNSHIKPNMDTVPMIAMISRLVDSKGFDLVLNILDELLYNENAQFVVLGTGDWHIVNRLHEIQNRHSHKLAVYIGFDEKLAHQIYAAADMFVMPSLYEPCGLSQMMAMRYGALPIVRETGGLYDTVHAYNKHTGEGNGFSFYQYADWDLLATIRRALDVYNHEPKAWNQLVVQAMESDYSWNNSAKTYTTMYEKILG